MVNRATIATPSEYGVIAETLRHPFCANSKNVQDFRESRLLLKRASASFKTCNDCYFQVLPQPTNDKHPAYPEKNIYIKSVQTQALARVSFFCFWPETFAPYLDVK